MKTLLLAAVLAIAALYFGWVSFDVTTTVDATAIKRDAKRAEAKARTLAKDAAVRVQAELEKEGVR